MADQKIKPECDEFNFNDRGQCTFPLCDCGEVLNVKTSRSSTVIHEAVEEKKEYCKCKNPNAELTNLSGWKCFTCKKQLPPDNYVEFNTTHEKKETERDMWNEVYDMIVVDKIQLITALSDKFTITRK